MSIARFAVLVAAVASLAAGCTATASPATAPASGGCPVPPGPVALAESGRQGVPAPSLTGRARQVVADHVLSGAGGPPLTLVSVEGTPVVVTGPVPFRSDAGNDAALDDDRAAFLAGVDAAVAGLRARTPEADPLGAFALAARAALSGTVVLADSGLQTVAPLDFREPGVLDADPAEIVDHLRRLGAVPDLRGSTVVLSGIGDTAEPQAPLDTGRRAHLVEVWRAIATAAGAGCVEVETTPRAGGPVDGVPAVGQVPVPALPNPSGETAQRMVLPDDATVGFRPESAEFRDPAAARLAIAPIATWLLAHPDRTATLTGTTARVGDDDGQRRLAARRAEAVRAVLVDDGVDAARVTTVGVGSDFPAYVPDHAADGTLLPGPAARNRTVVVDLR